jgi:hypothetical protein
VGISADPNTPERVAIRQICEEARSVELALQRIEETKKAGGGSPMGDRSKQGGITWADIDKHLGIAASQDHRAPFLEAGFSEEAATRGARLLESGSYFGFEDVALSLLGGGTFGTNAIAEAQIKAANPDVTRERIARVASRLAGNEISEAKK